MPRFDAARILLVLLLAGGAACTRRIAAPPVEPVAIGQPTVETAAARATVSEFVAAEARGDESADTLLASNADFIATGILRTVRPRLAGMVARGEGSIEEARTELSGGFAWVEVVYRFDSGTRSGDERARATFVLERRVAGWRIRHVHSSMVERWE